MENLQDDEMREFVTRCQPGVFEFDEEHGKVPLTAASALVTPSASATLLTILCHITSRHVVCAPFGLFQIVVIDATGCRNVEEVERIGKDYASSDGEPLVTVTRVPEKYIFHVEVRKTEHTRSFQYTLVPPSD